MSNKEKFIQQLRSLPRLRFTPTPEEGERLHVFLYNGRCGMGWFAYEPHTHCQWPSDAFYKENSIEVPAGSDPAEVAEWAEANWEKVSNLRDLGEDEKCALEVRLEYLKTRHEILDLSDLRHYTDAARAAGWTGKLKDFIIEREKGVVEEDGFYNEKFIHFSRPNRWGREGLETHYWFPFWLLDDEESEEEEGRCESCSCASALKASIRGGEK